MQAGEPLRPPYHLKIVHEILIADAESTAISQRQTWYIGFRILLISKTRSARELSIRDDILF